MHLPSVLALGVLLAAIPTVLAATEDQQSYPTGQVVLDEEIPANASATAEVTPKLFVQFAAGGGGGRVNVTVDVKWKAANLPEPLPEADGVGVLSYIQVTGLEDGVQEVRFRCLVDAAYRHDLLYWDGEGWVALAGRPADDLIPGRAGGRDVAVHGTTEEAGTFYAVVSHASAFALTSNLPPTTVSLPERDDSDRGAPAPTAALVLVGLGIAVAERRARI